MAIIQCPGCDKKMSNKAAACPHCGETNDPNERSLHRGRPKRKANLRAQQLIAASVFIAGALWMISIHLSATPKSYPTTSLIFTAAGGIWYLLTRARLLWDLKR